MIQIPTLNTQHNIIHTNHFFQIIPLQISLFYLHLIKHAHTCRHINIRISVSIETSVSEGGAVIVNESNVDIYIVDVDYNGCLIWTSVCMFPCVHKYMSECGPFHVSGWQHIVHRSITSSVFVHSLFYSALRRKKACWSSSTLPSKPTWTTGCQRKFCSSST